jgi:hypothetical protein
MWKENGVVAPIIEAKVLDQEEKNLIWMLWKVMKKRHWTQTSNRLF